MRYAFVLMVFGVLLAGCAAIKDAGRSAGILPTPTPIPCRVQAAQFLTAFDALVSEWDDANTLASKTSRLALSGPVARLQELRRKLNDSPAPECAMPAKSALTNYMNAEIEGYLLFMSQAPDAQVTEKMRLAKSSLDAAVAFIAYIKTEGQAMPTAVPSKIRTNHRIKYEATSASPAQVEIEILNEMGREQRWKTIATPWELEFDEVTGRQVMIRVRANQIDDNAVTCTIKIDDVIVTTRTESGGAVAYCDEYVP